MAPELRAGPYEVHGVLARGGCATVHLGRVLGPGGFGRVVVVKRLHPALASDPAFVAMLADEARVASRIQHANVATTLDVAQHGKELLLVLEYVHGESLARLLVAARARRERVPPAIACAVVTGVLQGLHAAHEATDPAGRPLGIVHRDVSTQNVMVGADGFARVIDFGVAKAAGRAQPETREGILKGKLSYMAPEQVRGAVDRRTDVYSASVVLWELLTGRKLFAGENQGAVLAQVMAGAIASPNEVDSALPAELSDVVRRGLSFEPGERFATAQEMAAAVARCGHAPPSEVGAWVETLAGDALAQRAAAVAAMEGAARDVFKGDAASAGSADTGRTPEAMEGPARTPSRGRGRGRGWLPAAVTLAAIGFAAATAYAVFSPRAPSAAPALAPAPAPAPAPTPTPTPTPESESESAPEFPSSTTLPASHGHPPPHAPYPSRRACDPPFRVDANGTHHYKPECL